VGSGSQNRHLPTNHIFILSLPFYFPRGLVETTCIKKISLIKYHITLDGNDKMSAIGLLAKMKSRKS